MSITSILELQILEQNQTHAEVTLNTDLSYLEQKLCSSSAVVMSDADLTLSKAVALRSLVLTLSGTLTAARNLIVPDNPGMYVVSNGTAGGYAVTVKTAAGTGVALVHGATALLYCDGTNVVPIVGGIGAQPVDVAFSYNGKPPANLVAVRHPFPFAMTIPANCAGSALLGEVAATADVVIALQKNGVQFGTATIAAGATTASFSSPATRFAAGDILKLVFPVQDATFADLGGSIYGTR